MLISELYVLFSFSKISSSLYPHGTYPVLKDQFGLKISISDEQNTVGFNKNLTNVSTWKIIKSMPHYKAVVK